MTTDATDTPDPGQLDVDPITLEVVRNALVGIAEEAGAALRRTAYSPNIKERIDCSTAVFDGQGRMVAQAEHIPVHLGSMPMSVAAAREVFPTLDPGDQVLVSDPYAGGTHLPDWTLIAPIHDAEGQLLGYAANRAHHSDVGGSAPGSMPAGATDIFAEGLRIPPVKLAVAGEESRDLVAMLLANTRTPRERLGDLRAQIGANRLTARRVTELAGELGVDGLQAAMAATLAHAERAVIAAIRELPQGTARFTDVMDGDGTGVGPIELHVELTLADGHVTVDLTGCAAQVPGGVNAPLAVTVSAAVYALRAVVAPQVPANDGVRRALTVRTTPGTIVDARAPASVAAANVETSQRIVDVLLGAFAVLAPDRVGAASQGTMNNTLFGGTDPRTGEAFTYYETLGGGMGAGPWGPGASGIQSHMTNTKNTPVEAFELAYPLRVVEYRLRDGSGGDGAHRGGMGLRRVLEVDTDDAHASLITERRDHAPWGAAGGGPGAVGRNAVRRAGEAEERPLPAKVSLRLSRGDRLIVETPGGGGYGPGSDEPGDQEVPDS
ncbi:MAG: hydantoinase B/oxoprolinase family protein [Nitriliruptoraceae bacterium]|nr:hydantoinase B/oxoprolinase family protein [Nitriliruptoraceae bacterium]